MSCFAFGRQRAAPAGQAKIVILGQAGQKKKKQVTVALRATPRGFPRQPIRIVIAARQRTTRPPRPVTHFRWTPDWPDRLRIYEPRFRFAGPVGRGSFMIDPPGPSLLVRSPVVIHGTALWRKESVPASAHLQRWRIGRLGELIDLGSATAVCRR